MTTTSQQNKRLSDTRLSTIQRAQEVAQALEETAIERDKKGGTAYTERNLIRESGLLNIIIPKQYGGASEDWKSVMHIVRMFANVDSSLAHLFGFQHLILASIQLYGTKEQTERYFKKTVDENVFWGNALNPLDKGTTVTKDKDTYTFNGTKAFCSGATDSDMMLVSGFLGDKMLVGVVPSNREGITINQDWDNFGQRQTDSGSVLFNNLVVKADEMLLDPGPLGNIQSTLRSCIAQLILTHIYLGLGEGAFTEAKKYTSAQTRAWHTANVNRAVEDPYILRTYGEMYLGLQTSIRMAEIAVSTLQQCWEMDKNLTEKQRGRCAIDIALSKTQAAHASLHICNKMFEVTGSRATNGLARLDRFWRNLRTHTLHDPIDYKLKEIGNFALNEIIPTPGSYS